LHNLYRNVCFPEYETNYTATVTDENGCTSSAIVPIKFDPLIFVPNAFTPDGDEFNNYFKAIAHNITEFEMTIFNRWGELIYVMPNLDETWDATYKGELVQDDVYIWQIVYKDINGKSYEMRGHVTVLK
jgi:gliding motility-associated-like protein